MVVANLDVAIHEKQSFVNEAILLLQDEPSGGPWLKDLQELNQESVVRFVTLQVEKLRGNLYILYDGLFVLDG